MTTTTFHSSPAISSRLPLVLSGLLAWGLIGVSFSRTGHGFWVAISWNMLLALMPLCFARLALLLHQSGWRWLMALCAALWLLWLPNAPYLATDLVHLRWIADGLFWTALATLLACAWHAWLLAVASLGAIERIVADLWGARAARLTALAALGPCALGVFLGRFIRWNSWDLLLRPADVLHSSLTILIQPSVLAAILLTWLTLVIAYLPLTPTPLSTSRVEQGLRQDGA